MTNHTPRIAHDAARIDSEVDRIDRENKASCRIVEVVQTVALFIAVLSFLAIVTFMLNSGQPDDADVSGYSVSAFVIAAYFSALSYEVAMRRRGIK